MGKRFLSTGTKFMLEPGIDSNLFITSLGFQLGNAIVKTTLLPKSRCTNNDISDFIGSNGVNKYSFEN